jgi:hypothetical protein
MITSHIRCEKQRNCEQAWTAAQQLQLIWQLEWLEPVAEHFESTHINWEMTAALMHPHGSSACKGMHMHSLLGQVRMPTCNLLGQVRSQAAVAVTAAAAVSSCCCTAAACLHIQLQ